MGVGALFVPLPSLPLPEDTPVGLLMGGFRSVDPRAWRAEYYNLFPEPEGD